MGVLQEPYRQHRDLILNGKNGPPLVPSVQSARGGMLIANHSHRAPLALLGQRSESKHLSGLLGRTLVAQVERFPDIVGPGGLYQMHVEARIRSALLVFL